jgi:hypothetical protein
MKPDMPSYLLSIGSEIRAQASRVRQLIGDKHWLSDGHHKELIIRRVLERHLPRDVLVCHGFLMDPTAGRVSREQDILIVDARGQAPIFNDGGLVVAHPASVMATISVKTRAGKSEIEDTVRGLWSVRECCLDIVAPSDVWAGMFAFESDVKDETLYGYIADAVAAQARLTSVGMQVAEREYWPNAFAMGSRIVRHRYDGSESALYGYSGVPICEIMFVALVAEHVARRLGYPVCYLADIVDSVDIESMMPAAFKMSR